MFDSINGAGTSVPVPHVDVLLPALATEAHRIVTDRLTTHYGNTLSPAHSEALRALVEAFASMSFGLRTGRWAFDLPCGMGKTQAVVAFTAALHRCGEQQGIPFLGRSLLIAASQVEALAKIKRDIVAMGVPETAIGLLHDKRFDIARATRYRETGDLTQLEPSFASEPATTENDTRPILLVSHNRIRAAKADDAKLARFGLFDGSPRDLVIWDEVLVGSDAWSTSTTAIEAGLAWLRVVVDDNDPTKRSVLRYVEGVAEVLRCELEGQRQGNSPKVVTLPPLTDFEQESFTVALGGNDAVAGLRLLVKQAGQDVRVAALGDAKAALVRFVVSVPAALGNIAILDASHTVNRLVAMDASIGRDPWFARHEGQLKVYNDVTINYMQAPSGRSSTEQAFAGGSSRRDSLSREIVDATVATPADEAVVIFTFKPKGRGRVDLPALIRRRLKQTGIDPDAMVPSGHRRVTVLTWGQHTSLSEYAFARHVVFAGVLQRSDEDLLGASIGQRADLLVDTGELLPLGEVKRGEVANVLYQAMSRGSCRFTDNGRARRMAVWLPHHDPAIHAELLRLMPGVRWVDWRGSHGVATERKAYEVALAIVEYLRTLPDDVQAISMKALKAGAGLSAVAGMTFSRARQLVERGEPERINWRVEGRSFVRADNPFAVGD